MVNARQFFLLSLSLTLTRAVTPAPPVFQPPFRRPSPPAAAWAPSFAWSGRSLEEGSLERSRYRAQREFGRLGAAAEPVYAGGSRPSVLQALLTGRLPEVIRRVSNRGD